MKKMNPDGQATPGHTEDLHGNKLLLLQALEAAQIGIWQWDIPNDTITWSDKVYSILGVSPATPPGPLASYSNLIHPDDRTKVIEAIQSSLEHKTSYFVQHRTNPALGEIRWVEAWGTVVSNDQGVPVTLLGSVHDITANKQADQDRDAWQARYELIATATGQVVYDYELKSGSIRWNGVMREVLGYTADEMGNIDTWGSLIHPDDRAAVTRELDTATRTLQPYEQVYRFRKKNGDYISIHDKGFFMTMGSDHAVHMLGSMQDYSHHMQYEAAFRENELIRKSMESSMPAMLYVLDVQRYKYIYTNGVSLTGYTPQEIDAMGDLFIPAVIHPEDLNRIPRWTDEPMGFTQEVHLRIRTRDGEWRWVLSRNTVFKKDEQGGVTQIIGIAQDITEQKTAEEALRRSEQSYRELFDSVGEAIYIQHPDGTFADVNRGACIMYGYPKEAFIGRTPAFLSAEGRNDFEALAQMTMGALKGIPQIFEWWGRKANGEIFLKEVRLKKGTYFGQDILIATAWDITQQNAMVNALRESEASFRDLFNTVEPIYIQNRQGTFLDINKRGYEMYGYTKEELIGKHPIDLAVPGKNDLEALARSTELAWQGFPSMFIWYGSTKDKQVAILEVTQQKGTYFGQDVVIATAHDITESRQAEIALRESEQRFRTLQQASFGGIGLHDQGRILDCNQGLSDMTGYSEEELKSMDGLDLIAPEARTEVLEKISAGYEKTYDVTGVRKDGSQYALEIRAKMIPYQGKTIRVTEFRNISDRKRAEEQIIEQNNKLVALTEDLKRKNEQLEEFTQIVSHNLRSPVGNILTLLSFFETAETDEERAEYLKLLKESGDITLTTLHELNEVLKIKQNRNIEKQLLRFEDCFHLTRSMLTARIAETGAQLICDFSEAPQVHYPKIYLESILLNLLSNALKYNSPDRTPIIHFKTYYYHQDLVLEVSDNGLGINLDRYGHQVFKLRKTFHRHPESRGIGLFMIKNQIEAMGGEITLSSKQHEGTTFSINFTKNLTDGN